MPSHGYQHHTPFVEGVQSECNCHDPAVPFCKTPRLRTSFRGRLGRVVQLEGARFRRRHLNINQSKCAVSQVEFGQVKLI